MPHRPFRMRTVSLPVWGKASFGPRGRTEAANERDKRERRVAMAAWAHLSISRCIINGTVSSVMTGIVPTINAGNNLDREGRGAGGGGGGHTHTHTHTHTHNGMRGFNISDVPPLEKSLRRTRRSTDLNASLSLFGETSVACMCVYMSSSSNTNSPPIA